MDKNLMAGVTIVNLALVFYSVGSYFVMRKKSTAKPVLWFLSLGITFDIIATLFMIIGSPNSPFTLHGFLGYSALLAMSIDLGMIWKRYSKEGLDAPLSKGELKYAKLAYGWWVVAYITGGMLVMMN